MFPAALRVIALNAAALMIARCTDFYELHRQAGSDIGLILKSERPEIPPVLQPS